MVLPVSVRPPRPGDGSGICEERDTREKRREEREMEQLSREIEALVEEKRENQAYCAFRELFSEENGVGDE